MWWEASALAFARKGIVRHVRPAALAAAVGIAALYSSPAAAVVAYAEGTSGDLSNNGLAPTAISLAIGDNTISGTSGKNADGIIDRDYFTFTLAPNDYLTSITVLQGTTPIGFSFIGVQSGNQVTLSPTTTTAAGLLGWDHYSSSDVGTDILDNMGVPANGSSGFTPPLGPGSYAFWVQEASSGTANYVFDFHVAEAPEPATWAMMLLGFGAVGWRMRRARRAATPRFA